MPSTTCGWCGRFSNMTWRDDAAQPPMTPSSPNANARLASAVFECNYCGRLLLAYRPLAGVVSKQSLQGLLEDESTKWLPRGTESMDYPDVPERIAAAASEAHEVRSINALRATILLARSVIEATAKDKGMTTGNLATKIDEMQKAGLIRPHVRDEAHEIRFLGNDKAHGDFVEPVDPDDADAVLVLMGEILEEVFQSPARTDRLRLKRESKKAPT